MAFFRRDLRYFAEEICGILPKRFAEAGIAGVFSLDIWETARHRIVCLKIRRGSNEPRLAGHFTTVFFRRHSVGVMPMIFLKID